MSIARTIEGAVAMTLHEPTEADGKQSIPMFFIRSGGNYTLDSGEEYSFGTLVSGDALVVYLPGHRAATVSVRSIIDAALAEIETPQ